jgi:hypothetical protein
VWSASSGARRGKPGRRGVAPQFENQAHSHASRTSRSLHGGNARAAHWHAGGLHVNAWTRCAQPFDWRRLCPSRRHADDHDHRPEGDHDRETGALPDCRRDRLDAPADEDGTSDRQPRLNPDDCAGRLPGRDGGATWAGTSGTPGRRRRGGSAEHSLGAAASDRIARCAFGGPRSRGRDDSAGASSAHHARRRFEPAQVSRAAVELRTAHAYSLLQHPDGEGLGDRRLQSLYGNRRAVVRRLCASRSRPCGSYHCDRSRHRGEAAVPHGPDGPEGDPCGVHAC